MALLFLYAYLLIGWGFSLAGWLVAAEECVRKNESIPRYFVKKVFMWVLLWPLCASYIYLAEVKKVIPEIDWINSSKNS
ncbi:hypothetical protein [Pseudoalteromonas sp. SR41-4]|uniref:hypothetical protein n=1 Tax=Pseudoalteromonas sp. SR41-4 TaxID=2760950 RepID=UPI0015FF1215|nr:hypothetical protein [Pseudoalteromonas sp. SR41-4]MBB1292191.1 hypothetical protein [Pseudoalteromonas sp. SR41-4]